MKKYHLRNSKLPVIKQAFFFAAAAVVNVHNDIPSCPCFGEGVVLWP